MVKESLSPSFAFLSTFSLPAMPNVARNPTVNYSIKFCEIMMFFQFGCGRTIVKNTSYGVTHGFRLRTFLSVKL